MKIIINIVNYVTPSLTQIWLPLDRKENRKKFVSNFKVRVGNYKSCMVITYDDFDSPGLTVMLTYHDDVSKILPSGKFKLENTVKSYRILESLPHSFIYD